MNDEYSKNGTLTGPLIFTVPAYGFVMALYLDWLRPVPSGSSFRQNVCRNSGAPGARSKVSNPIDREIRRNLAMKSTVGCSAGHDRFELGIRYHRHHLRISRKFPKSVGRPFAVKISAEKHLLVHRFTNRPSGRRKQSISPRGLHNIVAAIMDLVWIRRSP